MRRMNQLGRAGLAVVLAVTIGLAACSTAWTAEAEQIVAALIPAAANIVALVAALQGKSVSAADLATIQNAGTQAGADLQLVQSLIAAYQKADEAAKPGILNQIQAALIAAEGGLKGVLPALHIQDAATQAKITAVVGIVISEVESLAAIVPVVKTPTLAANDAAKVGDPSETLFDTRSQNPHPFGKLRAGSVAKSATRVGHPQVLTASEFVSSFNATLTAKTGNAELDRVTAGLRVHVHGKVVRWVSGGILK